MHASSGPEGPSDLAIVLITLAALSTGIMAFLLHVAGWVRMPFTLTFVSFPGLVVVAGVTAYLRHTNREELLGRLKHGLIAGALGTLGYDLSRPLVVAIASLDFNPFQSHPIFGSLITGQAVDSWASQVAGWGYHFWNGLTFGMMYILVAAGRRWLWGVAWALFLEGAMLLVYPIALGTSLGNSQFIAVSVGGHAVYGVILGIWGQRMPGTKLTRGPF